jgi:hypothetical protein
MKKTICPAVILAILLLSLSACAAPPAASTSTAVQTPTQTAQNTEPLAVSLAGPIAPYVPAGPEVQITVTNKSGTAVIAATASLNLGVAQGPNVAPYIFDFSLSAASPLSTGQSASLSHVFIGGGLDDTTYYPVRVQGTLEGGATFDYTVQAQIKPPAGS